jgi:sigma-E factor negative regulatory protein RseC
MVEEQVVITGIERQGVWIEGVQQSACGSCSAKAGCGQHAMSQLGRKVSLWMSLESDQQGLIDSLSVGQQIIVGLPEGAILRSTLALYGIPLLALLLGALLGSLVWGEPGAILLAILSMLIGFKAARHWSELNRRHWQPRYLRHCGVIQRSTS